MRSAAAMIVLLAPLSAAAAPPPALHRETLVCAPALEAWRLWTTNEGVASFFPGALNGGTNIKLAADGPYEIYFLPENAVGMRGCDGCTVLGWQEGKMLSFTWTNRPEMAVRPHRTHVVLRFESRTPGRTRVTLDQDGWGEGDDWRIAYDYFADAWTRVLDAFRIRLDAACGEGAASR